MTKYQIAFRLSAVAGLAVMAAAAQAFTLDIVSIGTFTNPGVGYDSKQTVVYQTSNPAGAPALTNTELSSPLVSGIGTMVTGDYTNGVDSFTFSGVVTDVQQQGVAQSFDGDWTYTGGTGGYANLAGDGTFAGSLNLSTGGAYTSFVGQFAAVPEPSSIAIVGVGLVGLLKRRRRS